MKPIWRTVATHLGAVALLLAMAAPGRAEPGPEPLCDHCSRRPVAYLDDEVFPTPPYDPQEQKVTDAVVLVMVLAGAGLVALIAIVLFTSRKGNGDEL